MSLFISECSVCESERKEGRRGVCDTDTERVIESESGMEGALGCETLDSFPVCARVRGLMLMAALTVLH